MTTAPRSAEKTALVTRPRDDAVGLGAALTARGFRVMVEPMLEIVIARGRTLDLDGVSGLLATSANGVRALAANAAPRDLPLWAVGDATGRAAREAGFRRVESAGGDVTKLAALVARRAPPGLLLHAAGSAVAGDLAALLADRGFTLRRQVLYESRPQPAASPALLAALDQDLLDLALFFSPRTAASFATLTVEAGRAARCRRLVAYALSPAVAQALAGLPWAVVRTAVRPEQEALLAAIDQGEIQ
jgi:uroporphyrinogen-III synthase